MCRMLLRASLKPFTLEMNTLKEFVASCHWRYFRKYNILGHHGLGWGFTYMPEGSQDLVVKRDFTPIYRADWKALSNIKTRFIAIHARKAFPWQKNPNNVHPIDIGEKYNVMHNGTIKASSFPHLQDKRLEKIKQETRMDTRKFLCSIMDGIQNGKDLPESLKSVLQKIEIGLGANSFIFNSTEAYILCYHGTSFNARHTTLFFKKNGNDVCFATTPIWTKMFEIPNNTLFQIDLSSLCISASPLNL